MINYRAQIHHWIQSLSPRLNTINLQVDFYKISRCFEDQIPVKSILNIETLSKDWEDFQEYSMQQSIGA